MQFPKMFRPEDEQTVLNALHAAKSYYEEARNRMEDMDQPRLVKQFERQVAEVETLIERIECEADFTVAA